MSDGLLRDREDAMFSTDEPVTYAEAFARGLADRESGDVWVGLHVWAGDSVFAGYMDGWRESDRQR